MVNHNLEGKWSEILARYDDDYDNDCPGVSGLVRKQRDKQSEK